MNNIKHTKQKSFSFNKNIKLGILHENFYMRSINSPPITKSKILPITSSISEYSTGFNHNEYQICLLGEDDFGIDTLPLDYYSEENKKTAIVFYEKFLSEFKYVIINIEHNSEIIDQLYNENTKKFISLNKLIDENHLYKNQKYKIYAGKKQEELMGLIIFELIKIIGKENELNYCEIKIHQILYIKKEIEVIFYLIDNILRLKETNYIRTIIFPEKFKKNKVYKKNIKRVIEDSKLDIKFCT